MVRRSCFSFSSLQPASLGRTSLALTERARSKKTITIEGASHAVMMSHADAVVELVEQAAAAAGGGGVIAPRYGELRHRTLEHLFEARSRGAFWSRPRPLGHFSGRGNRWPARAANADGYPRVPAKEWLAGRWTSVLVSAGLHAAAPDRLSPFSEGLLGRRREWADRCGQDARQSVPRR